MSRILAMGFGPFGQVTENPTESMVNKLGLKHSDLECHVLQTSYRYVQTELPSLLFQFKPDAVVLFGYAASADSIRLESVAKNRNDTSLQDVEGRCAEPLVLPNAPEQFGSTLPFPVIEQALALQGMESIRSSDAGGFVCNYSFFLLMHLAKAHGVGNAGLVHVPNLERYQERYQRKLDFDSCASVVVEALEASLTRPTATYG